MFSGKKILGVKMQSFLACILIVLSGTYVFRWIFYPEMTFYVDDWNWLYRSRFEDWTQWTLFPKQVYNDRPIGALIIAALYHLFGLNYTAYAVVLLSIHLANGVLLFVVASNILQSRFYGAIVGLLFVININVAYQAWWTGTIFDSTSLFFCLCSFLAFLGKTGKGSLFAALFYFIAVRSKEASLPFPFVLFAYSFIETAVHLKISEIKTAFVRAAKATWPVFIVFVVMLAIFIKHYLAAKISDFGPYAPKFNIATIVDGAQIYLRFISYDILSKQNALIAYLALSAFALVIWAPIAFFGSIAFLIAAAPVFVLATQRVSYYGYIPSPYIALLLVGIVQRLNTLLAFRLGNTADRAFRLIALAVALWFVSYVPRIVLYRESVLAIMRENSLAMKTLVAAVDRVEENSKVVITGLPPGPLHLFAHAPCHAIKVIYEVRVLDCHIDGTEADLLSEYAKSTGPKILLHYDRGNVTLSARSAG